ncbi:hypothetical protein VDG1235_153 [Verrucomicrobiia bacterium DG1235]|nr:hypothetical protein VDG1235_153 [Verrucomicrobiae bacterium DG1235]
MVSKLEELELGLVPLMFKEEQGRHYIPIWKFQEIEGLWWPMRGQRSSMN